ncbi:hypothetical protein pdam_00003517 [Pocillopora damicornis]|uniref:Major facilitator superfamily (MFS) profile domain-containing protein n=1 Tax=Pocillopora damicornis TaxID=46731 RepID=A0A3M6V6F1_POCDA|nr:hypothetical protein pdam_00003517 [Pocillopora damicornis]
MNPNDEKASLLHSGCSRSTIYSRNLSQGERILELSKSRELSSKYRLYRRRWYMLLVLFVLNVSNAMLWLSFAPVADYTASYYGESVNAINWLSIVFLLCYLLFGLVAVWILDLEMFSIPAFLGVVMATFGVCSSSPPTPPTASAESSSEPFFQGLKKNKPYLVLLVTFGSGIGLFTCLTTILEQVICPRGYSDDMAGTAGAVLIAVGLVGGGFTGVYVDKTKKFKETAKISYALAAVSCCLLLYVSSKPGQPALVVATCGLFGFFSFALMPVCLEVGVECTYPVAEATSAGLLWMAGQATGVIFILVSQALALPKVFKKSKCHQKSGDKEVPDYLYSMIFMTSAAVAMAILIIYGFNPPYKRLQMEQRKEAQKILQAGAEQRLPSIPNPSDPDIKNLC